MLELFGTDNSLLTNIGVYSTMTLIIVEVLKNFIPKKIPTAIVSLIIGIIVTIVCLGLNYGFTLQVAVDGIFTGFVTAFISMYGFDSLKNLWNRTGGER